MMGRYAVLRRIEQLDPQRDCQEISRLVGTYEFPWDNQRALEFALFRTYAVPTISALLDSTGEFARRAQKRYDDTAILIAEFSEWGYESERGRAALRQMNRVHHRFAISNDDYLYVLTTFVFEPIRWNARYGWRALTQRERLASFYFWREIGRRMGIRDIPDTYEALEAYNVAYERDHFRFAETNRRVGEATRDLFLSWFPAPLRSLLKPGVYAMMDDPLLDAFGFPHPPAWLRRAVAVALKLRGRVLRYFPPRRKPRYYTERRHRSYPDGYTIEALGPEDEAVGLRAGTEKDGSD